MAFSQFERFLPVFLAVTVCCLRPSVLRRDASTMRPGGRSIVKEAEVWREAAIPFAGHFGATSLCLTPAGAGLCLFERPSPAQRSTGRPQSRRRHAFEDPHAPPVKEGASTIRACRSLAPEETQRKPSRWQLVLRLVFDPASQAGCSLALIK